jgi:hypothetical protein
MPAIMTKNRERIIPFFAMIVLIIGIGSTLYIHATQSASNTSAEIIINGSPVSTESLFKELSKETISTDDGEKIGIPLDRLIEYIGIVNPDKYQYSFIASDGYQQTVIWENMKRGIFTEDYRVFFLDLAHAFWVRNIIEIEVKEI